MQAKEERQEREAQVARAQMSAALAAGANWGMGEDAPAEPAADGPPVDWREHAETRTLTDKQVGHRS